MERRGFLALVAAYVATPFVPRQSEHTASRVWAPSAAQGETATVNESWGLLRDVSELTDDGVMGTWGGARRIPGQQSPGSDFFGAPRPLRPV